MKNEVRIKECILNIDMICRNIFLSQSDIEKFKIPHTSVLYGDILRYHYIQLCSILDEFVILSPLAKNDEYLKDTLFVIAPALREIKKYSDGLRKTRNIMLAHLNRDKNKNFHPWWKELMDLKLPRTFDEIDLIFRWIQVINQILCSRYYDELKELTNSVLPDVNKYFYWVTSEESRAINEQSKIHLIFDEVEKRFNEKGFSEIIIDSMIAEKLKS